MGAAEEQTTTQSDLKPSQYRTSRLVGRRNHRKSPKNDKFNGRAFLNTVAVLSETVLIRDL